MGALHRDDATGAAGALLEHRPGAVAAAVVDDHDLVVAGVGEEPVEQGREPHTAVARRDHDAHGAQRVGHLFDILRCHALVRTGEIP